MSFLGIGRGRVYQGGEGGVGYITPHPRSGGHYGWLVRILLECLLDVVFSRFSLLSVWMNGFIKGSLEYILVRNRGITYFSSV